MLFINSEVGVCFVVKGEKQSAPLCCCYVTSSEEQPLCCMLVPGKAIFIQNAVWEQILK